MNHFNHIYNDEIIAGLDPVRDKQIIFRLSDLDWHYEIKPLFYYKNKDEMTLSGSKQLLISRSGETTEVAVRGKDFNIIPIDKLYDVFLTLRDPLKLELYALGHTREGKFIYVVARMNRNASSIASDLGFHYCIIIYTVNDGNGKTKFAPVWIKDDQVQYQVSAISGKDQRGKPTYLSTCYELSHHYEFDSLEAAISVKNSIEDHAGDFESKMSEFSEIGISADHVSEFHHRMYRRFEIGNEKTKRGYEKVTSELLNHHDKFNPTLPFRYQHTLCALYLSFVSYIDREKKRKLGKDGRITSINFTHDNVTKRAAFEEISKLASEILSKKHA
ncbi:hypothetical protein [Photobacterium galatheae]|uniref:Uncharacterized protein n=1 Tax=Photobacterium galatheae TaxID=1654360 RepID=A0A066RU46_9GAMM|nr:hypothetical protein [Photobacterium galatheae]KDM90913.1 hypothetical protein EA58_14230 [Photobacterium galatheae]MCM0149123.1 hypothetical protein [Photobacterium galatheae]